jgi:hypothetical protein
MKTITSILILGFVLMIVCPCRAFSQGLSLPNNDSTDNSLPIPYSSEELAEPPQGEIKRMYLREVNICRNMLQQLITAGSSDQQDAAIFTTFQSLKADLDKLATSRKETDLFALIPGIAQVFDEGRKEGATDYVQKAVALQALNIPILKTIAQYVIEQNGNIDASTLSNFVKIFTVRGFVSEPDWEKEPLPLCEVDLFVANAPAIVSQLKAGPWQQAQRFMGGSNNTSATFFARYESGGDGLPVLKSKYQQNRSAILSKFDELKGWVVQQEQASGGH